MRCRYRLATLAVVVSGAVAGVAQADSGPASHHAAHHAAHHGAERQPVLTLQASASSQVMQDSVTITLATELEAAEQAEVARQLTERLNATLQQAGKPNGIQVRNGAWRVWPNTDRDGRITTWRGRAEVWLESRDMASAASLAASLGQHMAIANVSFDLSPEARAAEEQRLLQQVASAFAQRAAAAAAAFGFGGYEVRRLDLGGSGVMAAPRAEGMMLRVSATADAAPPQLEPGETTVSLSVQGEVALQPSAAPARPPAP